MFAALSTKTRPSLQDRFQGSLLGVAVGDAIGARFEGRSGRWIRKRFLDTHHLFDYDHGKLRYTDDTQMTIGVAETLIHSGEILDRTLCDAFADNFDPRRGYGPGSMQILSALQEGEDPRRIAARLYPGGSFGNGAAMRVAPVGLFFHDDPAALWDNAARSALPTHLHPLGVQGAQLLALAVGYVTSTAEFDRQAFFGTLLDQDVSVDYQLRLRAAWQARTLDDLADLGTGMVAQESVVTAIACFAHAPDSFADAVGTALFLGGDTDTIGAMTGAISGAYLGKDALPARPVELLENRGKGRDYLNRLALELHAARARLRGQV